jgi:lipoate-protein ligase A
MKNSLLKILLSESFNPYLNLATEEWIFHHMEASTQVLFIWRNEGTVVIGRNQNPWSECNLEKMKNDGIHLARRTTGGGAVFHDLGNTNFTFLSPRATYKRENNVAIIIEAMKKLGIAAEASGRNDLLLQASDGLRKFSGSAYREKKDRAFHHGTLLIKADLSRLAQYLTPNPKKLQSKGKESVRARVANLTDLFSGLNHEVVTSELINSFESFYNAKAEVKTLSLESLNQVQELKVHYNELSSWDWLYGKTLEFNQRIDDYLSLGFFDFQFNVQGGVIQEVQIFSDCLYPALIEELRLGLHQKEFSSESVRQAFKKIKSQFLELDGGLEELKDWLCQKIEV